MGGGGGTTLHAGILAHWFEKMLVLLFQRYTTMVVNGILFGVIQPAGCILPNTIP